MDKSCDNCYWEGYRDMFCLHKSNRPHNNICDKHSFKCECDDRADYKYKEKYYCTDCLLKEFEVKDSITTHYYIDGEYIGSDDDFDEVIKNLDDEIKEI